MDSSYLGTDRTRIIEFCCNLYGNNRYVIDYNGPENIQNPPWNSNIEMVLGTQLTQKTSFYVIPKIK